MIARNFCLNDTEGDVATFSVSSDEENENPVVDVTNLGVFPKFICSKRQMVTRSMQKTVDEPKQSSLSIGMPPNRKRSRSDALSMKSRTGVFKLNPIYQASGDSPQQKVAVSYLSPKTKQKEMVSAILELARYGEEQYPKKKYGKVTTRILSKLTVRSKSKAKRAAEMKKKKYTRRTCLDKIGSIP